MRGTILGFDAVAREGVITNGAEGRVRFTRGDWKGAGEPVAGREVDFDLTDGRATDIFPVPGSGGPLAADGRDPAQRAMTLGIVSLVSAVASFVLGPIGIIAAVVALIFGLKGRRVGRDLPDRTGYYLSTAGLVITMIAIIVAVVALAAVVGITGALGRLGPPPVLTSSLLVITVIGLASYYLRRL